MRKLGKASRAGTGAPGGPIGGAVPGGHWAASASLLAAGRSRCPPVAHAGSIHGSCRPGAAVQPGCGVLSDSRIGPLAVIFIFLGLKLSGGNAWPWWWVTIPLWIAGGLGIIALLFNFVFPGDAALFLKKVGKPRARLRRPAIEGNSISQRL